MVGDGTQVQLVDYERRIKDLEDDVKALTPLIYGTITSVRQIEKSVERMEKNSDRIKNYFLAAAISGVVGIVFIALQNSLLGG